MKLKDRIARLEEIQTNDEVSDTQGVLSHMTEEELAIFKNLTIASEYAAYLADPDAEPAPHFISDRMFEYLSEEDRTVYISIWKAAKARLNEWKPAWMVANKKLS